MDCDSNVDFGRVADDVAGIITQMLDEHPLKAGSVFVIGCSSSEIVGGTIGHDSSEEAGRRVFESARAVLSARGIFLACQCCEHLNRCLVVEDECAEKYALDEVSVVPWAHGGGSLATAAWHGFKNPVVVEHIRASAGIDIGGTLIGMHLKEVAVPFRPKISSVGNARVSAAYTRPKLVGGERARYK